VSIVLHLINQQNPDEPRQPSGMLITDTIILRMFIVGSAGDGGSSSDCGASGNWWPRLILLTLYFQKNAA
jgi:hypothetical protein